VGIIKSTILLRQLFSPKELLVQLLLSYLFYFCEEFTTQAHIIYIKSAQYGPQSSAMPPCFKSLT
jgi:hypothetical protein